MTRTSPVFVAVLACALACVAGCKAKRGSPGEPEVDGATAAVAADRSVAATARSCPECGGRGLTPYTGDDRPCFLCDGDGRCPRCSGGGRAEGGLCPVCDGSGQCADCGGDAQISSRDAERGSRWRFLPGLCPVCRDGLGLCPGCGGGGKIEDGRECAVCSGAGVCPECGGSGEDPLSAGAAVCLGCRGHGTIRDGEPGPGWPDFPLVYADGHVVLGRLVEAGPDSIALAPTARPDAPVETVPAARISPLSHYLARLRFLDPISPVDRRIAAGVAARYPELTPLVRRDLRAGLAPSTAAVPEPRRLAADRALEAGLVADAEAAMKQVDSIRSARILLETALHAFPSGDLSRAAAELRDRTTALIASGDAASSPETIERRRLSEDARFERAVIRAAWWRARGERLAGLTGAEVTGFQRAERAAREAWLLAATTSNLADSEPASRPARQEANRAQAVRARALVGIAARLLDLGLVERARALAIRALAVRPDDEGAARFAAVVAEALARRALKEDR